MKKYTPFIFIEVLLILASVFLKQYAAELFDSTFVHFLGTTFLLVPIFCMITVCIVSPETQPRTRVICILCAMLLLFTYIVSSIITLVGDGHVENFVKQIPFAR